MKKIDRETVQRIIDAADIVEVVSDFVNLKKRGANYIGLCPFHNERTPSFSVSKTKGICKCFSCGKGGSPVNFIMEHEQMSFYEALRYLAKKYHIEIKEHEMTDEERQQASEREALMAVNDFALEHFSNNLLNTDDGRDIGLAYFRERGINDQMIKRFSLGYAIDKYDDLYKAAAAKGFDVKYLIDTGLCARSEGRQTIYDRFKGRVIYPVFSVSGRVVAFGGRTLRSDKAVAKYVNSPESAVYHKSRELYGLYQAKGAIVKAKKCILVEGYMDVISMHQAGVENVVASSGTSLTEGQIRLIHRFTDNVTVIYDSDAAGIKASLRGIDMLLAEGMNIKVLLLPEGDDPDSFAQNHSSQQVERYIEENETDFMRFKTRILLKDAHNDPVARAGVINDIIRSIAVIPDAILRAEYTKECSRMLEIDENTLVLQLQKMMAENLLKKGQQSSQQGSGGTTPIVPMEGKSSPQQAQTIVKTPVAKGVSDKLRQYEFELMKYMVKYGMASLTSDPGEEPITVAEYVAGELANDNIVIADPVLNRVYNEILDISNSRWTTDYELFKLSIDEEMQHKLRSGRDEIRRVAVDLADIENRERKLVEECANESARRLDEYAVSYIENILISAPDDVIRNTATELVYERHTLSKVHTRYAHIETERDRLGELVPRAVLELKFGILNARIDDLFNEIKAHSNDPYVVQLLQEQKRLYEIRSQFAKFLGERIVTPPF